MVAGSWFVATIAASLFAQSAVAREFPPAVDANPGFFRRSSPQPNARVGQVDESAPGLKTVPNAYIVELNKGASIPDHSEGLHARFHRRAEEENVEYQIRYEFTDESLFYGLSIELSGGSTKEALEALPEVRRVWPVPQIARPTPVGFEDLDIGGPVAPQFGFNTSVIRGANYTIDYNLKSAGVDYLHARGVKGKGVKIAIIDSGVDYNHPALGGGFGPGKKIAFGRNYVNDGQGGPEDPIAACSDGGHGTHVAGIIAGEDPKDKGFGLLGVSPEATLGMYRVFSCFGGASGDVIFQAIIDAITDGADIISMSLGSDNGWERLDPFNEIITEAKNRGIAVIVAAGNSGRLGPFLTGSPATAADAVAVASADSARYPTTYRVKSNKGDEWRYSSLWPMEGEFHVYASPDYDESLGCSFPPLEKAVAFVEENGWDITKTFFMIRQSRLCPISANAGEIYFLGFKGTIAWRDQEYDNPYDNDYVGSSPPLFILSMDHVDGPKMYDAVTADPSDIRLRFTDRRFLPVANPSAGFTSNYSTIGNTWEFNTFKPLLSAPGHLILSAWPLEGGGYSIISGTSMATPFVAGCYALLKSAYPDLTVDEITNLFTTTAQPAKYWGNNEVLHAVSHQGAGLINVWNAYQSGAKFDNGAIVVGQSAKPVVRNITLTNTFGRGKTFEISHIPAGLMQRTPYSDIEPVGWYVYGFPSKPIYAKVEFETPTTITLAAGESAVVSFVITPPEGVDPDTIPVYSGFIKFVSGRDVYTVPYQGLPYVINEVPALERDILNDNRLLPALINGWDDNGNVFPPGDVVVYNNSNGENPTIVYFARQPTDAYRLDLVAANTTFVPTYYGFNESNIIDTTTPELPVWDSFGGVDSLALLFDAFYIEPIYLFMDWSGGISLPDGSWLDSVPPGDYRVLLRLLPLEKEYDDAKNWESWLSPVLRLVGSRPEA
ncbi:kilbournase [Paramyrothecium foliicola]|nr:kilbournase [Paramyrothecium foliicola]